MMLLTWLWTILADAVPEVPAPPPLPIAPVPPEVTMPSYEGAFIKMFLTLLALLVVIFFSIWGLKRLARGRVKSSGPGRSIELLEKKAISPKTVLYVIEVGGRQIVLAESQLEVKAITTFEELIEPKNVE